MAAGFRDGAMVGLCLMAMVVLGSIGAEAQLSIDFYDHSCPKIYEIVRAEIWKAVAADPRNAASLIRLHFHDCFVNGCDGSLLLDNTTAFVSEKYAPPNNNSVRGFPVIDAIKAKLEAACPRTVSCADILAIASRDSAVAVGLTPGYCVYFGRRDSLTANISQATESLPTPFMDYNDLKKNFAAVGLNEVDLVALSGAHTVGRVRCEVLEAPPLRDSTIFNPTFHKNNLKVCDADGSKVLNLDHTTPDRFDNKYYIDLLKGETNFISDQVLNNTPGSINQALVREYAANPLAFAQQFALSTIKMGNIKPLTGNKGQIRRQCARVNGPKELLSESAASLVASQ